MLKKSAFALALSLLAGVALAQTPPAARIRGTIETVDGNMLTLKTRAGDAVTVTLAPDAKVAGLAAATLDAIKPGSFIGSAAVTQPDGTLRALEVAVFPPSMNGTGEGHYGWDLLPNSTMTNGTVGAFTGVAGRTMTVKYGADGEKTIEVPDGVPVVRIEPAGRELVKPGAHVVLAPLKGPDGILTAARITVGENGLVPPM
jgi:hypothetical protein